MADAENNIQFVFLCPYEGGLHRLRETVHLPKEREVYHCASCGGKVQFIRDTHYSLNAIRVPHCQFQPIENNETKSPERQY